jgi:glutathione S-transferase
LITVHHLESSRSLRILWLLEELELPYQVTTYQRDQDTKRAPASLKSIHPLGKSPVITDEGETIAESGAILEYLLDKKPESGLLPSPGTAEHLQYRYWLHFAEGSMMTPAMLHLVFKNLTRPPVPWVIRPLTRAIAKGVHDQFIGPEIVSLLSHIESTLASHDWFCGSTFSGADIQMSFPLEAYAAAEFLTSDYPSTRSFLERCRSRPAYQAALTKGGEFDLSFGLKPD